MVCLVAYWLTSKLIFNIFKMFFIVPAQMCISNEQTQTILNVFQHMRCQLSQVLRQRCTKLMVGCLKRFGRVRKVWEKNCLVCSATFEAVRNFWSHADSVSFSMQSLRMSTASDSSVLAMFYDARCVEGAELTTRVTMVNKLLKHDRDGMDGVQSSLYLVFAMRSDTHFSFFQHISGSYG